jgi:hypothetical protein
MNIANNNTGTLQYTAALGTSVTAMGTGASSARVGRIFGYVGAKVETLTANYARDSMYTGYTTTYSYSPYPLLTDIPNTGGTLTDRHGAGTAFNTFNGSAFWQTTMGFSVQKQRDENGAETAEAAWDFGFVSKGYPALRGLGGQ